MKIKVRIEKVIRKVGGKWILYSHDGSKKLGTFDSKAAAEKREDQIRRAKYAKAGTNKEFAWPTNLNDPGAETSTSS